MKQELELGWILAVQPQKGGREDQITCSETREEELGLQQEGPQAQGLSPLLTEGCAGEGLVDLGLDWSPLHSPGFSRIHTQVPEKRETPGAELGQNS